MIKAIGWLIKLTLFSVLILVLGNWIQWKGKSVSDQVKTQISHAERSDFANSIRRWTGDVAQDARKGARRKSVRSVSVEEETEVTSEEPHPAAKPMESIHSSERQKLRALIQELNTTTSVDRRGGH
jgi:hypothetical protein